MAKKKKKKKKKKEDIILNETFMVRARNTNIGLDFLKDEETAMYLIESTNLLNKIINLHKDVSEGHEDSNGNMNYTFINPMEFLEDVTDWIKDFEEKEREREKDV